MRQLKKLVSSPKQEENPELEKMIAEAKNREIPAEEQSALLEKIRSGDREPIDELVDSLEVEVLLIIKECAVIEVLSITEMRKIGKEALVRLAEKEIRSVKKERFFRFGEWAISQAISERSGREMRNGLRNE